MSLALDRGHRHPPLDPPLQRAWLVEREIMGGLGAQQLDDPRQPVLRSPCALSSRTGAGSASAADCRSASGMFADRQHEVDRAVMIALRGMPSIAGFVGILRDHQAAAVPSSPLVQGCHRRRCRTRITHSRPRCHGRRPTNAAGNRTAAARRDAPAAGETCSTPSTTDR